MSEKVALITWSDPHQNHVVGLCKPGFTPEGKDTWKLNPPQQELWYAWNECWDWVEKNIPSGYIKVGMSVGDAIENDDKVRSPQELISQSPKDAWNLAHDTLEPVVNGLDHFFVIEGTYAHVGKGAWTEKFLAESLEAVRDEANNSSTWRNLVAEFGGVKVDVAHHPSGNSNIARNYPAVASRLAHDVHYSYVMNEDKPPELVIRGHLHRFADSGRTIPTRAIILPCFQYKTSFVSRIGKDHDLPDIGMTLTLCEGGEYQLMEKRIKPREKRKVWTIKKEKKNLIGQIGTKLFSS